MRLTNRVAQSLRHSMRWARVMPEEDEKEEEEEEEEGVGGGEEEEEEKFMEILMLPGRGHTLNSTVGVTGAAAIQCSQTARCFHVHI